MAGVSLPDGYSLRTHVLLFNVPEGCVSVITHTSHCIQHMSAIKNAYVCVVNGQPELFETELQAQEYAMDLLSEWHESDEVTVPLLAVMSVNQWFQAEKHLQLLEDIADYDRMAQSAC